MTPRGAELHDRNQFWSCFNWVVNALQRRTWRPEKDRLSSGARFRAARERDRVVWREKLKIPSELLHVGSTICTNLTQLAIECGAMNLSLGFSGTLFVTRPIPMPAGQPPRWPFPLHPNRRAPKAREAITRKASLDPGINLPWGWARAHRAPNLRRAGANMASSGSANGTQR